MALRDVTFLSDDTSSPAAHVSSPTVSSDDRRACLERFRAALRGFFGGVVDRHELKPNPRVKENRRGPVSLTSPYRGVTQHKKTRKWESHIWKRGKQLYCGAFGSATDAAQAHDILALHLKGDKAVTNFMPPCYSVLFPFLHNLSQDEIVESLRRCAYGDGESVSKKLGRPRMARETRQVGNGQTQSGKKDKERTLDHWQTQYAPTCIEQMAHQTPLSLHTPFFPWNPLVQNPLSNDVFSSFPSSWDHERGFYSPHKHWLNDQTSLVVDSWSRDHPLPILQGHVIQVHGHQSDRSFILPECGISNKLSAADLTKKQKIEDEDVMYGTGSNGSQSDLEIQAAVRGISFANDVVVIASLPRLCLRLLSRTVVKYPSVKNMNLFGLLVFLYVTDCCFLLLLFVLCTHPELS